MNIQVIFAHPPFFLGIYSFGMPPHRADGDVIDLGEFPMEMRQFTPLQEE